MQCLMVQKNRYVCYKCLVRNIIHQSKGENGSIPFITSFRSLKNGSHHVLLPLDQVLKLTNQINIRCQNSMQTKKWNEIYSALNMCILEN
jgi:hypothetical protein